MRRLGVLGLLLCAGALQAGASGAAYLNLPQGAKSLALARALSPFPGEIDALWQNPASLGHLDRLEGSLAEVLYGVGFMDHSFSAGLPLGGETALGLLVGHQNASDSYRDSSGNRAGSFQVSSSSVGLSLGGHWKGFALGTTGRYLQESVDTSGGSGWAMDLGALAILKQDYASLSLVLRNLGSAPVLGMNETPPPMPSLLVAGLAGRLGDTPVTLTGEFRNRTGGGGTSYGVAAICAFGFLDLMAGYDSEFAGGGPLDGMSAGLSAVFEHLDFTYGMRFQEALETVYSVSMSWH